MIHCFSNDTHYMQYLVFYESLQDAYYPAYQLWQDVLEEVDNTTSFSGSKSEIDDPELSDIWKKTLTNAHLESERISQSFYDKIIVNDKIDIEENKQEEENKNE